jgi:hypothetical protein
VKCIWYHYRRSLVYCYLLISYQIDWRSYQHGSHFSYVVVINCTKVTIKCRKYYNIDEVFIWSGGSLNAIFQKRSGEVYSIQHYVMKFVSDLRPRSVVFSGYSGFLHLLNWPPQHNWNIVEIGTKHHNQLHHIFQKRGMRTEFNFDFYSKLV